MYGKIFSSKQGVPFEVKLALLQKYENIFGCSTSITQFAKRATFEGRKMTQIILKMFRKVCLTLYTASSHCYPS